MALKAKLLYLSLPTEPLKKMSSFDHSHQKASSMPDVIVQDQ